MNEAVESIPFEKYLFKNRLMLKENKLFLICNECGNEIGAYQNDGRRNKSFCDDCLKKHRREKDKKYFRRTNYWASPKMRRYRRKKRKEEKEQSMKVRIIALSII